MKPSLPEASSLLIVAPGQNSLEMSPELRTQGWNTNAARIDGSKTPSAQNPFSGLDLVADASLRIRKSDSNIKYFFTPEDTTDKAGERQPKIATYQNPGIVSTLKTLLWMVVSIGLSLLIGNFC